MAVHEGARWLGAALDSLPPGQPGLEVIIRDSTPAGPCAELVDAYRDRLAIDYCWMPGTASWTRKTNLGVEAARAPYACILHQDDLWLPGRFEAFAREAARHPGTTLFLSPCRIVDAQGRILGTWRLPLSERSPDRARLRDALLVQNSLGMPAPVFQREAYREVGGLDDALWYTADWDLWLKLAASGDARYDPHPRTAFRIHGTSLTMTGNRGEFALQLTTVLDRHLAACGKHADICRTSIEVNVLLASAAHGDWRAGVRALAAIARLGPRGGAQYLRLSRLIERAAPRLKARLAGRL